MGGGGSVAIVVAGGVSGCPVCGLAAEVVGAAAAADEVAVAPLRLPPVELPQPEEPGWSVVRLRVRLVLLHVVQADVA